MDKKSLDFLYRYLNNTSPVGQEASGQGLWLDYIKPYVDSWQVDTYGSVAAVLNPEAPYKVVLEAHADEIAWYVHYITKEGYIYVARNGGSDYEIAPSMRAKIHTETGTLPAVFGWPAIHVRDHKKSQPTKLGLEHVVLDAGFASDKEAAAKGVHVGTIVTFDEELMRLNEKFWVGRGLDNRIGGFMIAQVARRLHEAGRKLPFGVYFVNAVQEEVGMRGAAMMARRLQADVALVTDVTHDTQSPLYSKLKHGDVACGRGPSLTTAPAVHPKLRKMLEQVAAKHGIAFQREARSSSTGTDTDAFAYAHTGTASALISLPLKYMHTTVEMIQESDMHSVIAWMQHFLQELPAGYDFRPLPSGPQKA